MGFFSNLFKSGAKKTGHVLQPWSGTPAVNDGPDPLVVDTLKPASRWESEVPFHHATQDLHR
ncbi:hypothetical protein, partial [Corynebacterium appendicis]|uniref:hypothetical protein n=1 Tax=Corynebacterium appendicis TaxID=163202 RepID=UPI001F28C602